MRAIATGAQHPRESLRSSRGFRAFRSPVFLGLFFSVPSVSLWLVPLLLLTLSLPEQRLHHAPRRHGQVLHAHADGLMDGVRQRPGRGDDRHLADAADAVGMV